ncbi:hypothetical protein TARUN_3763 [Trichoderma arundinaceum]|uniref:NACHT domain-containing protein n=1 Tax=Trichoderma arundinaceum TaxID=490622 RepID=A0A395NR21_TRIAR|nr:hypothetical protein TARUN_3763 [Trichoderma arundinaceum]
MGFGPHRPQDWETMRDKTYAYVSNVDKYRDKFTEDEKLRKNKMKGSIIAWISASKKMQSFHKKNQNARICWDTGRWIFKRYREVNDWMKEDQPSEAAIWLQGSRGFGKTILTSLLIDELAELRTPKKNYAIPRESKIYYFYCQEEDSEHRTHLDILRGILHQMVDSNEELLPLCAEESSGNTNLADTDVAQSLIEAFLEYNSRQYVIIDGLDECETSDEMRKTAAFFMKQVTKFEKEIKPGRLRVLFMSQMIPELVNARVMPENKSCIQLKSTDNADDIRSYVKKRIPEFSEKRATSSGFNLTESDKEQIESIVCHRSEEMFLYAYLAIEYLLQQPTKVMLLDKVKEELLPKKLSQMFVYEKLLGTVKSELQQLDDDGTHWKVAKDLLGWLVCAKRPLKWHEMQSILSHDPLEQKVDFDKRMLRQNAEKYLGSLVHILDGDHIRIVHSTARRYIIQNEHIDAQAVQCDLAMLCLRYLCLLSSSNAYEEEERREKVKLGWFSFQDYACSQWHSHINTVITACGDLFCEGDYSQSYIDKFASTLQLFIAQHNADLTAKLHSDLSNIQDSNLKRFSELPFYKDLFRLWNHIYTHQKGTFETRNTIGIAQLEKALLENRNVLERNFTPNSEAWLSDTIQDYYGL